MVDLKEVVRGGFMVVRRVELGTVEARSIHMCKFLVEDFLLLDQVRKCLHFLVKGFQGLRGIEFLNFSVKFEEGWAPSRGL